MFFNELYKTIYSLLREKNYSPHFLKWRFGLANFVTSNWLINPFGGVHWTETLLPQGPLIISPLSFLISTILSPVS